MKVTLVASVALAIGFLLGSQLDRLDDWQDDSVRKIKVGIVVVGMGSVGCQLVRALAKRKDKVVVAIGDSKGFVHALEGFDGNQLESIATWKASKRGTLRDWQSEHAAEAEYAAIPVDYLIESGACDRYIIIDCTSDDSISSSLVRARSSCDEVGLVFANKVPLAGDLESYQSLTRDDSSDENRSLLVRYEATVGAGLPVMTVLRRLVDAEDTIYSIRGSLSGTMCHILDEMNNEKSFSEALKSAMNAGVTESDPREDLSGADVVRKMVIMAREIGWNVETKDVETEELIPSEMLSLPVDTFLDQVSQLDSGFDSKVADAVANDCKLTYLGTISSTGKIHVGLAAVPSDSIFATTQRTENAIEIHTRGFPEPLLLSGTGAGINSTVQALVSDVEVISRLTTRHRAI